MKFMLCEPSMLVWKNDEAKHVQITLKEYIKLRLKRIRCYIAW